jgi:hypothetical protein
MRLPYFPIPMARLFADIQRDTRRWLEVTGR